MLDRLTDDAPGERRESRDQRVLSPARLRQSVVRDLGWLLNTTNLGSVVDLENFPQVSKSVLNFGLPDLAGRTISGLDAPALEQTLRDAIIEFEPRLIANSVRVTMVTAADAQQYNQLAFIVEATLWSQPLPLRLQLRTQVDLEDGDIQLGELRDISEAPTGG